MEVNGYHQMFVTTFLKISFFKIQKFIITNFGTIWGWANDDKSVIFGGDESLELSFIFITMNRLIHLNDLFSNRTDSDLKLILKIRSPFIVIEFNSYVSQKYELNSITITSMGCVSQKQLCLPIEFNGTYQHTWTQPWNIPANDEHNPGLERHERV